MNEKTNAIINGAIVGGLAIGNLTAKLFLGNTGWITPIAELAGGIGGSMLASKIDSIEFHKLWELKRKNPQGLNHDLVKLSEHALKLTVQNGMKKAYEEDEINGIGRKLTKGENTEIEAVTAKYTLNVTDKGAIQFVDLKNHDNPLGELINEIANDLPVISEEKPFPGFFKSYFEDFFSIYFGELLKRPDYHKALIAYNREVQGLIFEAIKQNNSHLPENIIEEIQKKINELTPENLTQSIDEVNGKLGNITVRLADIKEIVNQSIKSKTLIIEKIEKGTLKCAEGFNIPKNLSAFKEQTTDYLFFKYGSFSYAIEDLTEAYFDYFSQKTKVNRILVKHLLLDAIKNVCAANDKENIYSTIQSAENEARWLENSTFFGKCKSLIQQNFLEFIGFKLDALCFCGEKIKDDKSKADYVKCCQEIVNAVVELSVAIGLTFLVDNRIKSKDILGKYAVNQLKTAKSQRDLLSDLLTVLSEQKEIKSELLSDF
jgi:hypothetical protein